MSNNSGATSSVRAAKVEQLTWSGSPSDFPAWTRRWEAFVASHPYGEELIAIHDWQLKRPPSEQRTPLVSEDLQGSDWESEEEETPLRRRRARRNQDDAEAEDASTTTHDVESLSETTLSSVRRVAPRIKHSSLSPQAKTLDKQLYLVLIQCIPSSHAALVDTTALSYAWETQAFTNLCKSLNLDGVTARTSALQELSSINWNGDPTEFETDLLKRASRVVELQCSIFDLVLNAVLLSGLPTEAQYDIIRIVNSLETKQSEVPLKDLIHNICKNLAAYSQHSQQSMVNYTSTRKNSTPSNSHQFVTDVKPDSNGVCGRCGRQVTDCGGMKLCYRNKNT